MWQEILYTLLLPNLLLWALVLWAPPVVIQVQRIPYGRLQPQGLTFLTLIVVRRDTYHEAVLRHEFVHVKQQRRYSPLGLALLLLVTYSYLLLRYRSAARVYQESWIEREANLQMYETQTPLPRIIMF